MTDVLASINSYLNTSRNRVEGLRLLLSVLKQCDTQVFQDNAATWLKLLVAILQTYDPPHYLSMTCVVLCELIRHVRQFSQLSRDFQNDLLPLLLNVLLSAKTEWQSEAVLCLCQCMKSYPGACGPCKNKIEQMVVGLLETDDPLLKKRACECFALLPRTGGGGNQGVKHTEAWSGHIHRVISSLNATLSDLYQCVDLDDDVIDTGTTSQGSVRFPGLLSEKGHVRTKQLADRFTTLTTIICNMLKLEFPAVVHVPVKKLLGFIQRALSVTPKYLHSKPTQERTYLMTVLPTIYVNTTQMLESLISCACSGLIPYSQAVNRCLLQVLKATDSQRQYGVSSPYSAVRCVVWQCVHVWVTRVGLSSGIEALTEDIMKHIHRDFVPVLDSVKLQQSGASKKLSEVSEHFHGKKKRGSLANKQNSDVGVQKKLNQSADADVCCGALKALTAILQALGPVLSPDVYKNFTFAAAPILTKCLSPYDKITAPIPYSQSRCRLGLYETLLASVQASHPTLAPPLQYAVNVFKSGTLDRNLEVSSFCKSALLALETIVHPRAPSLHVSMPPVPVNSTIGNSQRQVSNHDQNIEGANNWGPGISNSSKNLRGMYGNEQETDNHADGFDKIEGDGVTHKKVTDVVKEPKEITKVGFALDTGERTNETAGDIHETKDGREISVAEGSEACNTDDKAGRFEANADRRSIDRMDQGGSNSLVSNTEEILKSGAGELSNNIYKECEENRSDVTCRYLVDIGKSSEEGMTESKEDCEDTRRDKSKDVTSLGKRKFQEEEQGQIGKKQILDATSEVLTSECVEEQSLDAVNFMLQDFVNAGPDSD